MGILVAEASRFLPNSSPGSSDQSTLTSHFVGPCFPWRRDQFFTQVSDHENFATERLRSGLWARRGYCSRAVCKVRRESSESKTHLEQWTGGSAGVRNDGGMETASSSGAREERDIELQSECSQTSGSADGPTETSSFRISRRMLLGTSVVGLASMYHTPGMARAAADQGFRFRMPKGFWFLGDSEANMGSGDGEPEVPKRSDSRVYDATALGEPLAIGSEKERVWKRLLENRVIYLGEAEKVVDSDDKLLELEIVHTLRQRCFEQRRSVSLAFEAFPCPLQPQLNAYMNKRLKDEGLRVFAAHMPEERWLEYLPILQYCRKHGVRLIACGAPLEVLRTVQAKGVQAVSKADTQKYIPRSAGGYKFKSSPLDDSRSVDVLPNASGRFGPGPYRFAQARVVEDYTMSQVVAQIIKDGGALGMLIVIAGASHVRYGTRGTGVPAWIAKNKEMQKRNQAVVLLHPERQQLRKEGDVPEADFLWYSAAKVCTQNCFDRVEVARVMGAAGRQRYALPQDLQAGIKRGLIAPEVLQSFFELEQNPLMKELTGRFQGLRERWLADPRFLQRLAIEESISITTAVFAQYERRGHRFWQELDYVLTDTVRGSVVDFFTVWLPAPRLSFPEIDPNESFNALDSLKGLLGSFPDNAFQRSRGGQIWGIKERVGAILVGGFKLFVVGLVSALATSASSDLLVNARRLVTPEDAKKNEIQRSPLLKTALVYASFLGTSANLRYQVIAGVIEHWVADYWLASQPLVGSALSFASRVANSYYGTGQWVDLARSTGIQEQEGGEADSSANPVQEGESTGGKAFELGSSASHIQEEHASDNPSANELQESLQILTKQLPGSQASDNGSVDQLHDPAKVPTSNLLGSPEK